MGENEKNAHDADKRRLYEWSVLKDEETKSHQEYARKLGFPTPEAILVDIEPQDIIDFFKEKCLSKPKFLNWAGECMLREQKQVIFTLDQGVLRVCIYRPPEDEVEEKIIRHMLTILREGREVDKETIKNFFPPFCRLFEYAEYSVNYRKSSAPKNSSKNSLMQFMKSYFGENQENHSDSSSE